MTYPWRLRAKHAAVELGAYLVIAVIMCVLYAAFATFDACVVERLGIR